MVKTHSFISRKERMNPRLDFTVVKYDPAKYTSDGTYSGESEWTCIEDAFQAGAVNEYINVENAFINTCKTLLQMSGCTYTSIVMWSGFLDTPCNQDLLNTKQLMDTYAGIKDGSRLSIEQTCDLLRLSLRAFLDCSFVNLTHEIELKVGYEYYLHLNCRGIDYRDIENVVSQNGLYLNPRGGISSSKVKYDELSEFLKQAGTNCRFDPDTFYISDGQHSYYTILVFSEIIAWNISRRMRAALVVELSENYDYDITSMEDLYMIPNKPFILIYEEGRKATLGHEKVYIEDNPFEWKTYKVRDGHVYAVYQ